MSGVKLWCIGNALFVLWGLRGKKEAANDARMRPHKLDILICFGNHGMVSKLECLQ